MGGTLSVSLPYIAGMIGTENILSLFIFILTII